MTNEARMRAALFMIGNNLVGKETWDMRPLSYDMCCQLAELAFAVAKGEPHRAFDAACKELDKLGEQPNVQ